MSEDRPESGRQPDLAAPAGPTAAGSGSSTQLSEEPSPADARFPVSNPLYVGCPSLFIQTSGKPEDLDDAASLERSEGIGIVFTLGRAKSHVSRVRALAEAHHKLVGTNAHVLFDANRYSGKARRSGEQPLDPGWIKLQRSVGCSVALTDSPYIPKGDQAALESILAQTAGLGPDVVAVLPIHLDWLIKDRDALVEAINAAGVPAALVLEHTGDPLGVHAAVAGLVDLLERTRVKVGLLRSDVSVVGALAFGASFGAIGTITALRHIYPADAKRRGPNKAQVAAYVPWSMGYRTLTLINAAIDADPDHQERWHCKCTYCWDRMLNHIVSKEQAYLHSLAAIALLAEEVLLPRTALERRRAWVSKCRHGLDINIEIAADASMSWPEPKYLAGWSKLAARPELAPRPVVSLVANRTHESGSHGVHGSANNPAAGSHRRPVIGSKSRGAGPAGPGE